MLYVGLTARPFVSSVHIKLPIFARQSKESLLRWAQNVPPKTKMAMTTMRFHGVPQVSTMTVEELRQTKSWLNTANLTRSSSSVNRSVVGSWWKPKPLLRFYVGVDRKQAREISIWEQVLKRIPKDSARTVF